MTASNFSPRARWLGAIALAWFATFVGIAFADPPARVARLSYLSGTVSFSPAGYDEWAQAAINRPVIAGDRLWSDNGGRVELAFGSGALRVGATTSLVVTNIDDRVAQFELQQGVVDLRVRRLAPGEIVEIDTPNLALQVTQPGRYRIEADPQRGITTVVVREGAADVYGERVSYHIDRGQGYRFYGTDLTDSEYFAVGQPDAFDRFAGERDARFTSVVAARYVSPDVVGYEDLDRYGAWRNVSSYGNVWFPQNVARDWAPYRDGHWSWIDPWGWTWVDDAPWGFAPFHYGRWAYVDQRWGWVPGPANVRPVYAPALVAFVGGAGIAIAASSGPAIGWFPLAPREVYRPAYNVSRDYYRQVNVSNTVINTTIINNTYVSNFTTAPAPAQQATYANLRVTNAVTAVPPIAFAESRPVNRAAVQLPAREIDIAQVQAAARVAPSRTAFVGAAPAAQARPSEQVQRQGVVAKTAPPAAPIPVGEKLPALERNPGRPIERGAPGAAKAVPAAAPAPNVRIVNTSKPSATQVPPAKAETARSRSPDAAAGSPPPTPPGQAQGPAGRPPNEKGPPSRAGDVKDAQPPGESVRPGALPRDLGAPPSAPAGAAQRNAAEPPRVVAPQAQPTPGTPPSPTPMPRREGAAPDTSTRAAPPSAAVPNDTPRSPPGARPGRERQPAPLPDAVRPVPQTPPPVLRPPEPQRAAPQDAPRPAVPPAAAPPPEAPRASPPPPARPPEPQRAAPAEAPRAAPQAPDARPAEQQRTAPRQSPPAARLPEPQRVAPPPVARPPDAPRAVPAEPARTTPSPAAPPAAARPEPSPAPPPQARPAPAPQRPPAQAQPAPQPAPAAAQPAPPDENRTRGKGKDKDKDKPD